MGDARGSRGILRTAALVAAAVALSVVPAEGIGTILTTGATLQSGASIHPIGVTIDPAAPGTAPAGPDAGVNPAAPSFTGAMPALPGAGDGSDGAFSTNVSVQLGAQTWNFTSFTVGGGATVDVPGAATILVQGDVNIDGFVYSAGDGHSLTLICGGSFLLNNFGRFDAQGANSDVLVVAGGKIAVGSGLAGSAPSYAIVRSIFGDVELRAHGPDPMTGPTDISLVSGEVLAPAGSVTMLSSVGIAVGGNDSLMPGNALAGGGPLVARAFGGELLVSTFGQVDAADDTSMTLESLAGTLLNGYFFVGGTAPVRVVSVAGPVAINGGFGAVNGNVDILAGGSLTYGVEDTEVSVYGTGDLNLVAAGGGLRLLSLDCRSYTSGGDITAVASGDIELDANSLLSSAGVLAVRSTNGSVFVRESSSLIASGALTIHADDDVYIGEVVLPESGAKGPSGGQALVSLGGTATVRGSSVLIHAEGGVTIDASDARALSGDFDVLADDKIAVAQTISATGLLRLASIDGDLDVAQATLTTQDQSFMPSGAITVESWNEDATILAQGSTIRSGTSSSAPGPVALLVHGSGTVQTVQSFLLPRKVIAKSAGAKSKLVASGFFDTGPDAIDLESSATVDVGGISFPIAGLEASGKSFRYEEAGLVLQVFPSKIGSSRARFKLTARGEAVEGAYDPEGDLLLSFDNGSIDGNGTIELEKGKYTLGRKRGALKTPGLWLAKAKARLKEPGQGRDSLSLKVGVASDGVTPPEPLTLTVKFGDTFTFTIPPEQFTVDGEVHAGYAHGVEADLDYARELLSVNARGINLGNFLEGAQPVTVSINLGGTVKEVRVRMARKGTKLLY